MLLVLPLLGLVGFPDIRHRFSSSALGVPSCWATIVCARFCSSWMWFLGDPRAGVP